MRAARRARRAVVSVGILMCFGFSEGATAEARGVVVLAASTEGGLEAVGAVSKTGEFGVEAEVESSSSASPGRDICSISASSSGVGSDSVYS